MMGEKIKYYIYRAKYIYEHKKDRVYMRINRLFKKNVVNEYSHLEIKRTLGGKKVINRTNANEYLYNKIREGKPFLFGRFGSVEAEFLYLNIIKEKGFIEEIPQEYAEHMYSNAGCFSINNKKTSDYFIAAMKASVLELDMIGYWYLGMQEYLIDKFAKKDIVITKLTNVHPYDYEGEAWTAALKGKKVLLIHPFSKTIESQYKNREKIWKRQDILPEFDLKTLKAVQTIAGEPDDRFESWEDALEWMYNEAMKIDFDVAIIGCGAYGLPLAAKLKKAGKQAIHLGGVTQVLFGIKGGRFDTYDDFKNGFYNEYWVRPSLEETPEKFKKVEDGCYW